MTQRDEEGKAGTGVGGGGAQAEVVLASSSPWRRAMLAEAGLEVRGVGPEVDEDGISGADAVDTARRRAAAKARAVAEAHPDALVIGADQVLWLPEAPAGEAIGKPTDPAAHLARLRQLRGRAHHLTTAVAIAAPTRLGGDEAFEVTTVVHLRSDVGDAELRAYVEGGEAGGCAGGYMVERRGAWLIERLEGDWHNVVGLPLLPLVTRLRQRGWRLAGAGQPTWTPAGAGAAEDGAR